MANEALLTGNVISKDIIVVATLVEFSSIVMFLLFILLNSHTDHIAASGGCYILLFTGKTISTLNPVCVTVCPATVFAFIGCNVLIS